MDKPGFEIQFPSNPSPALMSRVLNYVEDLHRAASRKGLGNVSDLDHYRSGTFQVNYTSRRTLGPLKQLASKLLVRHNLQSDLLVPFYKPHGA